MTLIELTEKLKDVYDDAGSDDSTDMIRLFGILYAEELENFKVKEMDIMGKNVTGNPKYGTEIRKGAKLAKYVEVKPEFKNKYRLL